MQSLTLYNFHSIIFRNILIFRDVSVLSSTYVSPHIFNTTNFKTDIFPLFFSHVLRGSEKQTISISLSVWQNFEHTYRRRIVSYRSRNPWIFFFPSFSVIFTYRTVIGCSQLAGYPRKQFTDERDTYLKTETNGTWI